jgi:5,10-methylenetetrahydromethanopterin reductase
MKLGLRIPPCASPQDVATAVAQAEAQGFDYAWIPDSQLLWRDVWVTLGVAGARTSRIVLGTNVTNPRTRHSTVTASAAAAVDELTSGRFVLGIGIGDSSVRVMGWKPSSIAEMRDYIEQMRALWTGRDVAADGRRFHLKGATGRRIPVYVSASGPRMLQLAGEMADGVIMLVGIAKDALEYGLENIEIGARRAGRRVEDLDVVTGTFCHVGGDWRSTQHLARPYAAAWAIRHPEALRAMGVPEFPIGALPDVYPDLAHAEDWPRAIEGTDWVPSDVLAAFCEHVCLMGDADDVAAKVRRLASYGVRNLYIRGFYSYEMPAATVGEPFARTVLPQLRDA